MSPNLHVFTRAWSIRTDYKTGRQLGEFYILAGRPDDAREVLGHPMFANDPAALLALAQMEAPTQPARAFDLASRGLAAAGSDRTAFELASGTEDVDPV